MSGLTVAEAAAALLAKLDDMTTDQFSRGEERPEREALRAALAERAQRRANVRAFEEPML